MSTECSAGCGHQSQYRYKLLRHVHPLPCFEKCRTLINNNYYFSVTHYIIMRWVVQHTHTHTHTLFSLSLLQITYSAPQGSGAYLVNKHAFCYPLWVPFPFLFTCTQIWSNLPAQFRVCCCNNGEPCAWNASLLVLRPYTLDFWITFIFVRCI